MSPSTGSGGIATDSGRPELIRLCRDAGQSSLDLIIAGEGNASVFDEERMWVTTSGSRLATLREEDLVSITIADIGRGLEVCADDGEWQELLRTCTGGDHVRRPTVEVGLHVAMARHYGPGFILHTHPTAALAMMAAGRGDELATTRLIPDHVVLCGTWSRYLPYIDPGLKLARTLHDLQVADGQRPNVIMLAQHGIAVHAPTAQGALDATLMVSKAARILQGIPSGTAQGLSPDVVEHIATRPDERFRRETLGLSSASGLD